ncbi:MAG: oxidoreductase [Bradyrhizobium sp.]|nr:MAG: oxidoreductase [Bradyrhizobium sp.]
MKQVQQNYRSGELKVAEAPAPRAGDGEVLVATRVSLISSGTERQLMQLAKSSLLGKAAARPDLVRRVVANVRKEGVRPTLEKVFAKLDTPIPLGYSLVGEIIAMGRDVTGHSLGDRVACAGAGLANHAEFNAVPKNLVVPTPAGVDDEDASFVTLGAIALQGVRLAAPTLGECVVVLGLGLIGLLTVQVLKANGCVVIGFDPNPQRATLAKSLGADVAVSDDLASVVAARTGGHGADAVIITASSKSNEPVNNAAEISRLKGRIVVVGLVGLNIEREPFYRRELELRLSMSYGPGRGDPAYELAGRDYPLPYVRWTEQRNMAAFLSLIEQGRVTPKAYVSHRFPIEAAEKAYELMESGEPHLAILLTYPDHASRVAPVATPSAPRAAKSGLGVAFIGLGNYARAMLLPKVRATEGVSLTAVVTKTGISASHSRDKFGFAIAATDPEAAIGDAATDAVFVATRHNTHAALAARALRAGKHVFCEKPLAIAADELQDVIAAAKAGPVILAVGFNRRFAPLLVQAKAALEPRSGPLMMIYRINAGVVPAESWIQTDEGGGRILGEVCHFIDSLTYLCGSLPVAAHAVSAGGRSDSIVATLQFADGSTGAIVYSAMGDPSLPKEHLEAFANGKVIRLDDFSKLTIHSGGKARMVRGRQDKGQTQLLAAFLTAARGTAEAPIPLAELEAVTAATLAVEEALRSP